MTASKMRTMLLATVAAAIALLFSRKAISASLIGRGDALLFRAQPSRAIEYYRRALTVDATNELAADRFAFAALLERKPADIRIALQVCSQFLRERPRALPLRLDRALLLRAMGNANAAESDFEVVGLATHDARMLAFAGFTARSAGQRARSQRLFQESLRLAPAFAPARRALDRERGGR